MADRYRILFDPPEWDEFANAQGAHLLQSRAWGELKARFGWSALRVALDDGAHCLAGAQILFRRLPLGLTAAYVPRGPIADPNDRLRLEALLEALRSAARSQGAFALMVEPDWPEEETLTGWFAQRGWQRVSALQPRTTIHLDLSAEPDAMLALMKPKWRYNIRLAERKGVRVREGGPEEWARFYELMQVTARRDHFAIHSPDYYRAALELLIPQHAALLIAEHEGEALAAILVTAFNREAVYLYGASGNSHRDLMPNHALHWAAIQWAQARGCARYDLWGIADATVGADAPAQLPAGLAQFKQGFGGSVVRYAGGFETVFSRARYGVYRRALALRRGLR